MKRAVFGAVLTIVLGAAVTSAPAAPRHTAGAAVVKVAFNKKLKKKILVDAKGMTLYLFVADYGGKSGCNSDCAQAWPALKSQGSPQAGAGVKAALLGTITRDDGTTQVTYAGHPLYTFAGGSGVARDKKPGDAHGQGYATVWWVVSAAGKAIKT